MFHIGTKEKTMMMMMMTTTKTMTTVLEDKTSYGMARTWWFAGRERNTYPRCTILKDKTSPFF